MALQNGVKKGTNFFQIKEVSTSRGVLLCYTDKNVFLVLADRVCTILHQANMILHEISSVQTKQNIQVNFAIKSTISVRPLNTEILFTTGYQLPSHTQTHTCTHTFFLTR